jgi:glycoprotein-N-acetylgalactosamine 3-beta-galactosyltransferase
LDKFAEVLVHNKSVCYPDGSAEDWEMGRCLENSAIFVDCRDELLQKRFFPIGVEEHMKKSPPDPNYWYTKNIYYHVHQGGSDCCSDTSIEFHYIDPHEMYSLDYLIYKVQPFGIDHKISETFPTKFSLAEIIQRSDVPSSSPNFKKHFNIHHMEPSEIY